MGFYKHIVSNKKSNTVFYLIFLDLGGHSLEGSREWTIRICCENK